MSQMVDMLQYLWSVVGYDHKNISPTWRASVATAGHTVPAIATLYHRNGNIFDYIGLHSSADILNLMYQASSALMHIHSKNVVHGDICPVSFPLARSSSFRHHPDY
jgi:serine/threonine protein kinase